jgi:predicted small secreted protein
MKTLIAATLLAPMLLLAACNTTQGVGEDLESAGKEISKTADENK